jgi:hypothetical protein
MANITLALTLTRARKAEYNEGSALARDSIFEWASTLYDIKVKFSAGMSDGAIALYNGLMRRLERRGSEVMLRPELYENMDGTNLGYATDWVHIKRKVRGWGLGWG